MVWTLNSGQLHKKVRVEFQDQEGTKYSLSINGRLTRDKIGKIFELMEQINGPIEASPQNRPDEFTSFGKLQTLIDSEFPAGEFSSSDVARIYEDKYSRPVKLSTISTYLTRLTERGLLRRQKFGNSWTYRRAYIQPEALNK